jgi:hypothetical protein
MQIKITMKTGNESFQSRRDVVMALEELARRFSIGQYPTKVMDHNGQEVGTVKITGEFDGE